MTTVLLEDSSSEGLRLGSRTKYKYMVVATTGTTDLSAGGLVPPIIQVTAATATINLPTGTVDLDGCVVDIYAGSGAVTVQAGGVGITGVGAASVGRYLNINGTWTQLFNIAKAAT